MSTDREDTLHLRTVMGLWSLEDDQHGGGKRAGGEAKEGKIFTGDSSKHRKM